MPTASEGVGAWLQVWLPDEDGTSPTRGQHQLKYPKRSQYKYVKSRYRVSNWAEYEAGLQKRGDLTVWLSDTALAAWRAPASGKPGGGKDAAPV